MPGTVIAPLNVFSVAKLATMPTPTPAPNEDASTLTWLDDWRGCLPQIYRSHWSKRTLSPLSSLPTFQSDIPVQDLKQLSKGQKKRQCSAVVKARANPAEVASNTCPARHQAALPSHTTSLPPNALPCHAKAPANVPTHRELLS